MTMGIKRPSFLLYNVKTKNYLLYRSKNLIFYWQIIGSDNYGREKIKGTMYEYLDLQLHQLGLIH